MALSKMPLETSLFYRSSDVEVPSISTEESVLVTQVPYQSGMIVLMNHPASITLYKYVSIKVLSGSVSLLGYEVTPQNTKPLRVFSSEKTGLIEMKTETFEQIWRKRKAFERLERVISTIIDTPAIVSNILSKLGNSTVAVHVQYEPLPINIECLELYYPQALDFGLPTRKREKLYVPKHVLKNKDLKPILFSLEEEKLASEIEVLLRNSKTKNGKEVPRIIVCGPKNTGKSTLLRFLVNKTLAIYPSACYLDTDPGQTEFTPPGVVSITKVNNPIFGPPFVSQRKPTQMIFTGSISPSFLELYSKSVYKLMELYNEEDESLKGLPLFVNTMGWMEGTGLQCLINTIDAVKPTVLVEIVSEDEISMFDYRDYLPDGSQYFQISRKRMRDINAKERRELSLLSHLFKSVLDFEQPMLLNEVTPYSVSWKEIPIYIFPGRNVPYARLAEAANMSIVALCNVPESSILKSEIPEFHMTLEDDPDNVCLAFGFVKAIDELNQLLHIVSPLNAEKWKEVNAIIKGNVMVPDCVILNQEVYDVPLPFTAVRKYIPSDDDEEEMKDISMVSLNILDEGDPPAANFNAHGSVKRLRRSIPLRNKRSNKK